MIRVILFLALLVGAAAYADGPEVVSIPYRDAVMVHVRAEAGVDEFEVTVRYERDGKPYKQQQHLQNSHKFWNTTFFAVKYDRFIGTEVKPIRWMEEPAN